MDHCPNHVIFVCDCDMVMNQCKCLDERPKTIRRMEYCTHKNAALSPEALARREKYLAEHEQEAIENRRIARENNKRKKIAQHVEQGIEVNEVETSASRKSQKVS